VSKIVALILALAGVPLFAVMAFVAIIGHRASDIDLQAIIIAFYQITELPLLETLPLFAFSGYVLARSDAPTRLIRVTNALFGWLPGGLAIVAIWLCSLVTAMTGASGVTIVALGGILLPAMLKNAYPERFSLGLLTTGGSLGLLFPPSLPIILYAVMSETPVEDLFIAGFLPGLLILTLLSFYTSLRCRHAGITPTPFSWKELRGALRASMWEVPLPFFVATGIYSGGITVSEAAVTAATYILIVEVCIYRDVKLSQLGAIARESMVLVGGILIILGMSLAVTNYIIDTDAPRQLLEYVRQYMTSPYTFLLALNLFLLLVGCMIDIYAATTLVVPLLLPIAAEYEISPVHLGVIFLTNMGIGYATPPVGMNLFIASIRFRKPVLQLYWASIPFIALLLLALAVITYWPALTLVFIEE